METHQIALLNDLEKTRKIFDEYVENRYAKLAAVKANAENVHTQTSEKTKDLASIKEELEAKLVETRKQQGTKKGEADAVLQEVAALRVTLESKLPAELAAKNAQLEAEAKQLEAARKELEAKQAGRNLRKNEMSKGVTFYKERLGLSFERMPDSSLSFRMTLIDPANPARPFTFAVLVNRNNTYEVLRCEPRIDFEPLLAELNRNNNFSTFVQQMRRRFKQLV